MSLAVERESPLPSAGSRPGRPAAGKRQAGATTARFCIRLFLFALSSPDGTIARYPGYLGMHVQN